MSLIGAIAATMGGARVTINNASIIDITPAPTDASAGYQLTNAGIANEITIIGGTVLLGNWITPAAAAGAAYEARVTETSGSLTTGIAGTWLALNTTRTWSIENTSLGVATCTILVEIRRASDGTVLDTATITLEANKEA